MNPTIDERLIDFALNVLNVLEQAKDWSPDTLDAIATSSIEMGLADGDDDWLFRLRPEVAARVGGAA